ncbi:MAG: ABC transporter permease [Actinomycetota bacterium]|nr:MAG: ABC-type tungstate transport permease [Actinomycetota bacterium]MDO8949533.1 ABC transporter permease [Actinomycetota bacterium]MDP3630313.1 ABC transporter permease [Actinomycetota bacterium]
MDIFIGAFRDGLTMLVSGATDVWSIVLVSIQVSGVAVLLALVLGIPIGFALGTKRFVGRRMMLIIANTGMGLPPVVVGLVVAMLLSRRGPFGKLELLYSQPAMVFAQLIIALPVVAAVSAAAVSAVPRELRLQARSLGASRLQEALMTLKEARMGLLAAVAAGFGSIISEVGAVTMVGGNLAGKTRVMTTAIVQYTRMGDYGPALALASLLMGMVLVVNILLTQVQQSAERYEK